MESRVHLIALTPTPLSPKRLQAQTVCMQGGWGVGGVGWALMADRTRDLDEQIVALCKASGAEFKILAWRYNGWRILAWGRCQVPPNQNRFYLIFFHHMLWGVSCHRRLPKKNKKTNFHEQRAADKFPTKALSISSASLFHSALTTRGDFKLKAGSGSITVAAPLLTGGRLSVKSERGEERKKTTTKHHVAFMSRNKIINHMVLSARDFTFR